MVTGIQFCIFFIMNLILWGEHSSAGMTFDFFSLKTGQHGRISFTEAKTLNCSHSILNHGSYSIALVWYNNSIDILGSILWLQKTGYWTSSSNKYNSTNDSRTNILHKTTSRNSYGWYPTIWMHFHSIILYHELNLESPGEDIHPRVTPVSPQFFTPFLDLLYVWIYFPGLIDFDRYMFGNNNSTLLFPFGCWRLSMVVAKVKAINILRKFHLALLVFWHPVSHLYTSSFMPVIITEQSCLLKVSPPQLFISVIHSLWRLIFSFLLELLDSLLAIGSSEKFMEQSKSTKYKETRLPVNIRKGTFG